MAKLRLGAPGACGVVVVCAAALAAGAPRLERYTYSEPHMGTLARLVIYAGTEDDARNGARAAFDRIAALDATLSDYRPDSELMVLASHAGQGFVPVSADLFTVLDASQQLAVRTGGAFDVTCGTVTRLWRSARRLDEVPAAPRVDAARATCGFRRLTLDPATHAARLEQPGMTLDVGAIAKGFAVDAALDVLRQRGLTRALAALGGDIAVGDAPPDADGWSVAIERLPVAGAPDLGPLVLARAAVSTAGDSEQWMTANGVRYSHILDLRTGWPMTTRSSTTVVARRGIEADGLDTALAVLGPRDGMPVLAGTPGAAAAWVVETGAGRVETVRSPGWPARRDAASPSVQ